MTLLSSRTLRSLFLAAVLPLWGACAGGAASGPAPASTAAPGLPASEAPAREASSSPEELEALYRARLDSARMNVHPADVDFMTGMIAHHAQALIMSAWAPTHGASPVLLRLTSRIINAQRDEIRTMQNWLRDRGQPVPTVDAGGRTDMPGMGMSGMLMPGMLTPEQLHNLDAARGADFDRLFLVYMIQHHQGAVTMVRDLFATDGAAQDDAVFKIASDIQVDQTTEIARMQRMLDALTAGR